MIPQHIIDQLLANISNSAYEVIESKEFGDVETEPSFTDRLVANIERDVNREKKASGRIKVRVRTLKDRGPKSAEKKFGADIATVIDIDLPSYKIKKGFLAQSKMLDTSEFNVFCELSSSGYGHSYFYLREREGIIQFKLNTSERDRLLDQCDKMLKITPDSFVFIYSAFDIFVCPAISILGTDKRKNEGFPFKNITKFFREYFSCFIGDRNISDTKDETFEELSEKLSARQILYFTIGGQ